MSDVEKLRAKAYRPRTAVPKGGRIVQVFTSTDMRCQHDGLYEIAHKNSLDLDTLEPGEYVAFFNNRRNMLKIAAANNVIASRKLPNGRFYDLSCIEGIIRAFHNDGKIDYDTVLRKKLETILERKSGYGTGSSERDAEVGSSSKVGSSHNQSSAA